MNRHPLWAWIRNSFPPNRVVALLTPPLALLAGSVAAWLAEKAPWVSENLGPDEISAIFIGGAATVVAAAYKWLDNWGKYESDVRLVSQRDKEMRARAAVQDGWDGDTILSQPDDVHPSDAETYPDEPSDPETADDEYSDDEELSAAQADKA